MSESVIRYIGAAQSVAQYGGKHPDAKAWKGPAPGVLEVVSDFDRSISWAANVVRFELAICVLHRSREKSLSGVRAARTDMDLIAQRLRAAAVDLRGTI